MNMKELQQAVATAFAKVVESGAIEQAIEKEIASTVTGLVKRELESYSAFGKALQDKVRSAMAVDMNDLSLPGYNKIILEVIQAKFAASQQAAVQQIANEMDTLLQPPPAEIKLSELIAQFIESNADDCDDAHISLHVEESTGSVRGYHQIAFDKESDKSKYSCSYRLHVTDAGEVFSFKIDDEEVKKSIFAGPYYNFDRTLFQMYAAGTKLIVDGTEDDIDTYYPGRD